MVIELLHFDGCTNTAEARRRLQTVLDANELEADVQLVEVRDFEEASSMRFLGSPTTTNPTGQPMPSPGW